MKLSEDGTKLSIGASTLEYSSALFMNALKDKAYADMRRALKQICKFDPKGETPAGVVAIDCMAEVERGAKIIEAVEAGVKKAQAATCSCGNPDKHNERCAMVLAERQFYVNMMRNAAEEKLPLGGGRIRGL
jgi:hypothetical protein